MDPGEDENEVQETIEASLSLERDLHTFLAKRVNEIEKGLALVENGVEYHTDVGRIDLLAKDKQGNNVVIELKAGKAMDNNYWAIWVVLHQTLLRIFKRGAYWSRQSLSRELFMRQGVCHN